MTQREEVRRVMKELRKPVETPRCAVCGEVSPYGDARFAWIEYHGSRRHRIQHWILQTLAAARVPHVPYR